MDREERERWRRVCAPAEYAIVSLSGTELIGLLDALDACERERDEWQKKYESECAVNHPQLQAVVDQYKRLEEDARALAQALDELQDHHCSGMCELNHDLVMQRVNR